MYLKFSEPPIYTRPPADGSCPPSDRGQDWIEFGDYCYLFVAEAVTFGDARLQCHLQSAEVELSSIHSDNENQFLNDHMKVPGFEQWWWTGMFRTQNSKYVTAGLVTVNSCSCSILW